MLLASILIVIFLLISLLHLYWLFGGRAGITAALPEREGHKAFTPPKFATFVVASALFGFAVLVAALAGWVTTPLSTRVMTWFGYGLSLIFFLRAVGDFNLMGFFKRIRGTRFSKFDTVLYSPLCLFLAIGVFIVTRSRNA